MRSSRPAGLHVRAAALEHKVAEIKGTNLQEEALLGVHKLSLRGGDAKESRVEQVHPLEEAAKPGAQLALAIPGRLQIPARV